jgi:hypothetical protein
VSEVVIDFKWERAEFLNIFRRRSLPWVFRYLAPFGIIFIVLGIVIGLGLHGKSGFALIFYVIGAVYILYGLWFPRFVTKKTWTKGIGIQGPVKIIANDSGVSVKTSDTETKATWRLYALSTEWSSYYLLRQSKYSVALVIPKRGFAISSDEAIFRSLLRAHTSASLVPNAALDAFDV